MTTYETLILAKPDLERPAIEELMKKVSTQIEKSGGTIKKVDEWGVRRLAYEIKKCNEGFYVLYEYEGAGETVRPVEEFLRLQNPVMRFKTTLKPKLKRPPLDLSQMPRERPDRGDRDRDRDRDRDHDRGDRDRSRGRRRD